MEQTTKDKGLFDGITIVRIPEDVNPIKLIPANIPPLDLKVKELPKHWFHGKPTLRRKL